MTEYICVLHTSTRSIESSDEKIVFFMTCKVYSIKGASSLKLKIALKCQFFLNGSLSAHFQFQIPILWDCVQGVYKQVCPFLPR
jgi:hypothetical protein